jgi:hypothetical protein
MEKELGTRQDIDSVKGIVRRNLEVVFDLKWIKE